MDVDTTMKVFDDSYYNNIIYHTEKKWTANGYIITCNKCQKSATKLTYAKKVKENVCTVCVFCGEKFNTINFLKDICYSVSDFITHTSRDVIEIELSLLSFSRFYALSKFPYYLNMCKISKGFRDLIKELDTVTDISLSPLIEKIKILRCRIDTEPIVKMLTTREITGQHFDIAIIKIYSFVIYNEERINLILTGATHILYVYRENLLDARRDEIASIIDYILATKL